MFAFGQFFGSLFHSILFIPVGILGIGFLIGFHELGHFLFCKLFRVSTPSFSIGIGPRILKKKIGSTEFSLSAIPMGGYVEIAGAAEVGQGEQKQAYSDDEYSFARKPYYQKMLIISGGIIFNLMFAYFILTMLYFFGMPKSPVSYPFGASTTIDHIVPDSPAATALKERDVILAVNEHPVASAQDVITHIKALPNQPATLLINREGQEQKLEVTIGENTCNNQTVGFLGVDFIIPRYSFVESVKKSVSLVNFVSYQVFLAFKGMFVKRNFDSLGGPLMIITQTIKSAEQGFGMFLLLLAFISINLALINILPLPIFDGGQALQYTVEAIIRRPMPEKIREYMHYATWILVLLLLVYLTVKDVIKIFWKCQ